MIKAQKKLGIKETFLNIEVCVYLVNKPIANIMLNGKMLMSTRIIHVALVHEALVPVIRERDESYTTES